MGWAAQTWSRVFGQTDIDQVDITKNDDRRGSAPMDNLLDDIDIMIRRCEASASEFDQEPLRSQLKAIIEQAEGIGQSWSQSTLGYHANTYYEGFRKPRPGEYYDSEWGSQGVYSNRTSGKWNTYDPKAVVTHIYRLAGISDFASLDNAQNQMSQVFDSVKDELLASMDALLSAREDRRIRELRDELDKLPGYVPRDELWKSTLPRQVISRDSLAMQQGLICLPHIGVICTTQERLSYAFQTRELAKLARKTKLFLEKSLKMKGASVAKKDGTIFIGHGGSQVWRDLKDFIQDRLKLIPDEYNLQPAAGMHTIERLQQMLDNACFAFLIMTAEDQQADGSLRARE